MSKSPEHSGSRRRKSQKPARCNGTGESGAAAGSELSYSHAPPRPGDHEGNLDADQDEDNAPRDDGQQPDGPEIAASNPDDDEDVPVYVGECRSSASVGAATDESDTLVVEADHAESGVSDADHPVRAKQLEALMAASDDIVGRMGRGESGGRGWSSGDEDREEEGDENEDESETTGVYRDREHVSDASPAVEGTPGRSSVIHGRYASKGGVKPRRSEFVYLQKLPREGTPYISWSQQALRRVCRHRHIKNMSKSKDNALMAELLEMVDAQKNRSSPFTGDCRKMGDESASIEDARQRKERSIVDEECSESLGASRKKTRLEEDAKMTSTAAVDDVCRVTTPDTEALMTTVWPPPPAGGDHPGAHVAAEYQRRMSEIEIEKAQVLLVKAKMDTTIASCECEKANAERAKVKRNEFEELLKAFEEKEKELHEAKKGSRSPAVVAILEKRVGILRRRVEECDQ